MKTPEDVDKLVWGPFNVNNPAVYLPSFKGKKVGIVVKGCDSRSVVEQLQENLIRREDVTIFALPCEGTLDMKCGIGICGRCNIGGRYVCVDGPVFTWKDLQDLPPEL